MARYAIEMNGARRVVPLNFVVELVRRGDLDLQTRAWRDGSETTVAAICSDYERAAAARNASSTSTPDVSASPGAPSGSPGSSAPAFPRVNTQSRASTYATEYDMPQPNASYEETDRSTNAAVKFVFMFAILSLLLGAIVYYALKLNREESSPETPGPTPVASEEGDQGTEAAPQSTGSDSEWDGDLDDPQDVLDDLRSRRDSDAPSANVDSTDAANPESSGSNSAANEAKSESGETVVTGTGE